MPGARPRIKPLSASGSSGTSLDEVSQLELHLQRQLEEDVARIFDESIYSDLEVVCGKLKILTHSCILKARTHKFYHKLEAILHVNIGRNTFDEIYSFISDAYTECDIQHQENEIISYLNDKLKAKPTESDKKNKQEELDESETYATPTCISPEDSFQKTLSSSPSTELTKEYYALVPIEGQILDKELLEQDELSTAFQSFIHLRTEQLNDSKTSQCVKPTTLSLNSSHLSKINKHSIIGDISKELKNPDSCLFENDTNKISNATSQVRKHIKSTQLALKKSYSCETSTGAAESGYSPDSLWADEASSSSDYLSAAHSATPPGPHAGVPASPPDNPSKMNNTASDSGFDNNAMLESVNSHKDVTLADVSLTESSFHDLMSDEATLGNDSVSDIEKKLPKSRLASQISITSTTRFPTAEMSGRSSKDEKQRQNEEIVILESSSLSSETGSWESVFPPKMSEKDLCEKFIGIERQDFPAPTIKSSSIEANDMPFHIAEIPSNKTTCCFIDASSLADEEERHQVQVEPFPIDAKIKSCRFSSQPVPCESKQITSPNDYSESNDNDDSLEQPDPDSIQKDISPTIFEMSLAPEDSVAGYNNTTYEDLKVSKVHGVVPHESVTGENSTQYEDFILTKNQHSSAHVAIAEEYSTCYKDLKVSRQEPLKHLTLVEESHTSYDGFQISKQQNFMIQVSLTEEKNNQSFEDLLVSQQQNSLSHVSLEKNNEVLNHFGTQKQHNLMSQASLLDANNTSYEVSNQQNSLNDRSLDEERNTSYGSYNIKKQPNLSSHIFLPDTSNTSYEDLRVSSQQNSLKDVSTEERNAAYGDFTFRKHQHLAMQVSLTKENYTSYEDLMTSRQQNSLPHAAPGASSSIENNDSLKPSLVRSHFMTSTPNNSIISLKATETTIEVSPATSRPQSYAAAWVVDMSKMSKQDNAPPKKHSKPPGDKTCDSLRASSKSGSNSEGCKSRSSVDSDSSEKSTHKFYIDLSTLPDASAPEQNSASEASSEKKNIFSMFIDLGENSSTIKEMPARLSSSLNSKKNCKTETKQSTPKTVKSNKKSPGTVNGDETFEKLESLCNSSQMSLSEILQSSVAKKIVKEQRDKDSRIAPTIREEPDTDQFCDVFVRLSDLDRTPVQSNDIIAVTTTESSERMTRSIPDSNWGQLSHTSSRSIDIISSFHSENALSLNRLFPHLKNDISRSMPGSLSGRTRSPLRVGVSSSYGDRDDLASDISEMSSVQSSMCRSVVENSTTEDTSHTSSLLASCQSRLGQDLLRMFVEEIAPDVVVEVSGRRIKAHKCILSSRCQYFAGILSGGWVESAGNVISLPPFSYNVVHFALCHIYSGISTIPDSISIVELATIADMLSLEGLKEAIMFTLKAKYCHHFHEPCQVCTAGVLECFPLSSVYGLDELYRRCLRWITRHFRKVWPTKAFATLPTELLDKCYQEHLLNLTTHNLIDTVQDCGLTVASLQRCRWAEVVARLCRRLTGAAAQFAGARLSGVVRAAAAPRAPPPPAAARALDACLASAVECAAVDELCRALSFLQAMQQRAPPEATDLPDTLSSLRRRCETAILRNPHHARAAPSFRDLPPDLRRRLRRYCDAAPPTPPQARRQAPPPPAAPVPAALTQRIERVRTAFVPYAQKPPPPAESARPRAQPAPPRVRTTKAQEERAKFNMTKSTPVKPREKSSGKPTKPHYENAKPRYLEPKTSGRSARKALGRLGSSSDSSRNLSPVLAAAAGAGGGGVSRPRTADPSTDSLSDSLTANKYATYTKPPRRQDSNAPTTQSSKCDTIQNQSTKTRATKIPVYLNQSALRRRPQAQAQASVTGAGQGKEQDRSSTTQSRHRGSLMMATKSSSAKMVPKIIKEQPPTKTTKPGSKQREQSPSLTDIPAMERSGTFLKDEPTFGDKTTNIDIDE